MKNIRLHISYGTESQINEIYDFFRKIYREFMSSKNKIRRKQQTEQKFPFFSLCKLSKHEQPEKR